MTRPKQGLLRALPLPTANGYWPPGDGTGVANCGTLYLYECRVERRPGMSKQQGPGPLAASGSSRLLRFVHFPTFLRDWHRLGLGDDALRALERELIGTP